MVLCWDEEEGCGIEGTASPFLDCFAATGFESVELDRLCVVGASVFFLGLPRFLGSIKGVDEGSVSAEAFVFLVRGVAVAMDLFEPWQNSVGSAGTGCAA